MQRYICNDNKISRYDYNIHIYIYIYIYYVVCVYQGRSIPHKRTGILECWRPLVFNYTHLYTKVIFFMILH